MGKSSLAIGLALMSCHALAQAPKPGVFVPPYPVCRDIESNGQVERLCVNASISASTREGRRFAEDSDCQTVKTQRPFRPLPAANQPDPADPRLSDAAFMADIEWARDQARASACSCCHDTSISGTYAAWDLNNPYVWIDQMTDRGLAIMSGDLSTELMGTYPAEDNFGFDRSQTGSPTTDIPRMKRIFQEALSRRGVTAEDIAKLPSANGPFETVKNQKPVPCATGLGLDAEGRLRWGTASARYIYVTTPEAANPLPPPIRDLPEGTIWKLDVSPSADPLPSGVAYGSQPQGSFQSYPPAGVAPTLLAGTTYRLYVLRDMLRPIVNCTFTPTEALVLR